MNVYKTVATKTFARDLAAVSRLIVLHQPVCFGQPSYPSTWPPRHNLIGRARKNPHSGAGPPKPFYYHNSENCRCTPLCMCSRCWNGAANTVCAVNMGQCGITSSKTVLVFLNLIFWVRERLMLGDWAAAAAAASQWWSQGMGER